MCQSLANKLAEKLAINTLTPIGVHVMYITRVGVVQYTYMYVIHLYIT